MLLFILYDITDGINRGYQRLEHVEYYCIIAIFEFE